MQRQYESEEEQNALRGLARSARRSWQAEKPEKHDPTATQGGRNADGIYDPGQISELLAVLIRWPWLG